MVVYFFTMAIIVQCLHCEAINSFENMANHSCPRHRSWMDKLFDFSVLRITVKLGRHTFDLSMVT
jgi:hypothetical protein